MNEYIEELEDNVRDEADESRSDLDRNSLLSTASRLSAIKHGINVDPEMKNRMLYRKVNDHQVKFTGTLPSNKSFSYRNVDETRLYGIFDAAGRIIRGAANNASNWWNGNGTLGPNGRQQFIQGLTNAWNTTTGAAKGALNGVGNYIKGKYNNYYNNASNVNSRAMGGNKAVNGNVVQQIQNEFNDYYKQNYSGGNAPKNPADIKALFDKFKSDRGITDSNITPQVKAALSNIESGFNNFNNNTNGLNARSISKFNKAYNDGTIDPMNLQKMRDVRDELMVDQVNKYQDVNSKYQDLNQTKAEINSNITALENALKNPNINEEARRSANIQLSGYRQQSQQIDQQLSNKNKDLRAAGFNSATGNKIRTANEIDELTRNLIDRYNKSLLSQQNGNTNTNAAKYRTMLEKAGYQFDTNGNITDRNDATFDNVKDNMQKLDNSSVTNAAEFKAITGNKVDDIDKMKVDYAQDSYNTALDNYNEAKSKAQRRYRDGFDENTWKNGQGRNVTKALNEAQGALNNAKNSKSTPGVRNIAKINGQYVYGSKDDIVSAGGNFDKNISSLSNQNKTDSQSKNNPIDPNFGKTKPNY